MSEPSPNHSRLAGSIMASVLVLMVGVMGVCAVAFLVAPDHAAESILGLLIGLAVLLILVLGVMPRVPMPTGKLVWLSRKKARDEYLGYNPRLDKPVVERFGTNAPPTVEEVRELKDTSRTWVPSRTVSGRSRPRK